jgi:cardiolipin synthase
MVGTDPTLWAWIFFLSEWAIRLVMLVVVPFRRTPAAAKGWLLLIFFEPWVGLVLYLMLGRAKLPRWRRERLAKLPQAMARVVDRFGQHPNIFHLEVGPALSQAVALAETLGGSPILGGNAVELLVDYNATLDVLLLISRDGPVPPDTEGGSGSRTARCWLE